MANNWYYSHDWYTYPTSKRFLEIISERLFEKKHGTSRRIPKKIPGGFQQGTSEGFPEKKNSKGASLGTPGLFPEETPGRLLDQIEGFQKEHF